MERTWHVAAVLKALSNNLPGVKPELWRDVPGALLKSAYWWTQRRLNPSHWQTPFIASLKPRGLLEVQPGEAIAASVLKYGVYEFPTTLLVTRMLEAGDFFVDVGANIGYYTVVAGLCVGPSGRVLSFEPVQALREQLKRNASLNHLDHAEVRSEIVTSIAGPLQFYELLDRFNLGLGSTIKPDAPHRVNTLPGVTLDEALKGQPGPRLIKVDVEGAETAVFEGARDTLAGKEAPAVLFESHVLGKDAQMLREHGFQIFAIDLHGGDLALRAVEQSPVTLARSWEPANYLAAKRKADVAFAEALLRRSAP